MHNQQPIHHLLQQIGAGRMNSASADTSWIARLTGIDEAWATSGADGSRLCLPAASAERQYIWRRNAPQLHSIELLERAHALWNLTLLAPLAPETLAWCEPHVDFLAAAWQPGYGVGTASDNICPTGDLTAVTYQVLTHFARIVDWQAVLSYQGENHFRYWIGETKPSVITNIHALGALRADGGPANHTLIQKLVQFLGQQQTSIGFWLDPRHLSPYYPTSHAIITAADIAPDLCRKAVAWMLATQNDDGSWGTHVPSAEETAYCLQALVYWQRRGHALPEGALLQGSAWLAEQIEPPYPLLWLGECLYAPDLVVCSAILTALNLCQQLVGSQPAPTNCQWLRVPTTTARIPTRLAA